jgi:hypothetical protein
MNTTQNPGYSPNITFPNQEAGQQPVYAGLPNIPFQKPEGTIENAALQTPYTFAQDMQAQPPVYAGLPNAAIPTAQPPVYSGAPIVEAEADDEEAEEE